MDDVKRRFAEYKRVRKQEKQEQSEPYVETSTEGKAEENQAPDLQDTGSQSRDPATNLAQTDTNREPVNGAILPPSPPSPTPPYFTLLKILLWILLWGFFVEVGFGTVFFITSLLYLLVTSLRGSRRKPWEPSAYSVFNRNFEAIDGTLSAEQFERELRYGPMSVRK